MGKHAYMILAHNKLDQLALMLRALDDPRNDFFLLLDCKLKQVDEKPLFEAVRKGRLFILPDKIDVRWGQYSQVRARMRLLETATEQDHYDYYHNISGQDLPLKNQDEIHAFFDEHGGWEFLSLNRPDRARKYAHRCRFYYGFLKSVGRPKSNFQKICIFLAARCQKLFLGVDRQKLNPDTVFMKGGAWFSISDAFARYCVSRADWVAEAFDETYCGDEMLTQTLLYNSPFRDKLYQPMEGETRSMRCTDWTRGKPYTFRSEDYEDLISSKLLFARKFDIDLDREIVLKLVEHAIGSKLSENNGRRSS